MKQCTRCGDTKPLDQFYRDSHSERRRSECKACHQERMTQYRERNKERLSQNRRRRYYENHKEVLARKAAYQSRPEVRAKNREKRRQWVRDNPDKVRSARARRVGHPQKDANPRDPEKIKAAEERKLARRSTVPVKRTGAWSSVEDSIAMRDDLTVMAMAYRLGRSYQCVVSRRRYLRNRRILQDKEITLCSVEGCPYGISAHGLCSGHNARQRHGQDLDTLLKALDPDQGCSIEGCGRPHQAHGLCRMHAQQEYRQSFNTATTRNGEPWTEAEDAIVQRRDITIREIQVLLGRTYSSVTSRRSWLEARQRPSA